MKKKEVYVDYWDKQVKIDVPEDATIVEGKVPDSSIDVEAEIKRAIENPVGMKRPREYVNKNSKILIGFDNCHRPGLTKQLVIPRLLKEVASAGVDERNITLVCAGGACEKAKRRELLAVLGPDIFQRFWPHRILNHDASQDLADLGISEMGARVEVNKLVAECDFVAYVGQVWPLSFGGFSGNGVVIGLGSARSIAFTHSFEVTGWSNFSDHRTSFYQKHKQSIHKRIEDAIGKPIFYIETVISPKGEIFGCFAGHSTEINQLTRPLAESVCKVRVPKADVVVVGVPEHSVYGDTNNPLIARVQTTGVARYFLNENHLVREGGVIIGLTRCDGSIDRGLRPSDNEVIDLYGRCFSSRDLYDYEEEFFNRHEYLEKYRLSYAFHPIHPFLSFNTSQFVMDYVSHVIFAGAKNPGAARKVGCTPAKDFDEAWRIAEKVVGKNPQTVVFPNFWSKMRLLLDVH